MSIKPGASAPGPAALSSLARETGDSSDSCGFRPLSRAPFVLHMFLGLTPQALRSSPAPQAQLVFVRACSRAVRRLLVRVRGGCAEVRVVMSIRDFSIHDLLFTHRDFKSN